MSKRQNLKFPIEIGTKVVIVPWGNNARKKQSADTIFLNDAVKEFLNFVEELATEWI